MNEVFYPVRVFYAKKGRMKFISHLDMNRCISRVLKRSRLPVWYTLGFHPHLYLTFALPLSLGFEGDCESFDFRLTKPVPLDVVKSCINEILPEGLVVREAAYPEQKPETIAHAVYRMECGCDDPASLQGAFSAFCAQGEILAEKHSKKGLKTIDIRPHFEVLEQGVLGDSFFVGIKTSASPAMNLNPQLIWKAFGREDLLWQVTRTEVLDNKGRSFR